MHNALTVDVEDCFRATAFARARVSIASSSVTPLLSDGFPSWPPWRSGPTQPDLIQIEQAGMLQIDGENHHFAEFDQVRLAFQSIRSPDAV